MIKINLKWLKYILTFFALDRCQLIPEHFTHNIEASFIFANTFNLCKILQIPFYFQKKTLILMEKEEVNLGIMLFK